MYKSREEKLLDYERNLADNRKEGIMLGKIVALESVLGMAVTPFSELERLSLEKLQSRVQQLQSQIPTRNGFKSES